MMLSEKMPSGAFVKVDEFEPDTPRSCDGADEKRTANEKSNEETKTTQQQLDPSENWTGHQLFYIFALDGVGGMVLSAGVNFALAYGQSLIYSSPSWKSIKPGGHLQY